MATSLSGLPGIASVPQDHEVSRRVSRFTEQVANFAREIKEVPATGTSYISAIDSNEGLEVTAGSLGTVIYASGGLKADANGLAIKLDGASLTLGASGLSVTTPAVNYITAIDSNEGLEVNAGSLGTVINASGGLEVGASGFGVKLDGASLTLGAGGLSVTTPATNYITAIDSNEGLEVTAGSLGTVINASGGLEVGASGFGIKLDGATLSLGASGLSVTTPAFITAVDSNEGLEVTAGSLGTVINASGGLEVGASGFGIKLDGASLALGASGLSVTARSYGAMYISSSSATTCTTAGTFYKAAGTTTAGSLNGFTMPSNNRLTYGGTPTINAIVTLSVSMDDTDAGGLSGATNTAMRLAKDGTTLSETQQGTLDASGGNQCMSCSWIVSLATNSYLEAFISVLDEDAHDVTVENMTMTIVQI